jgi:hypothetical protein
MMDRWEIHTGYYIRIRQLATMFFVGLQIFLDTGGSAKFLLPSRIGTFECLSKLLNDPFKIFDVNAYIDLRKLRETDMGRTCDQI